MDLANASAIVTGGAGGFGAATVRRPSAEREAFAERWVRTVRNDCLDRILILRRRHLERVLRAYTNHYNEHRPHRAAQARLSRRLHRQPQRQYQHAGAIRRRDLLGGLIHEYQRVA
jgi:putative transposase